MEDMDIVRDGRSIELFIAIVGIRGSQVKTKATASNERRQRRPRARVSYDTITAARAPGQPWRWAASRIFFALAVEKHLFFETMRKTRVDGG